MHSQDLLRSGTRKTSINHLRGIDGEGISVIVIVLRCVIVY